MARARHAPRHHADHAIQDASVEIVADRVPAVLDAQVRSHQLHSSTDYVLDFVAEKE